MKDIMQRLADAAVVEAITGVPWTIETLCTDPFGWLAEEIQALEVPPSDLSGFRIWLLHPTNYERHYGVPMTQEKTMSEIGATAAKLDTRAAGRLENIAKPTSQRNPSVAMAMNR